MIGGYEAGMLGCNNARMLGSYDAGRLLMGICFFYFSRRHMQTIIDRLNR